MRRPTTTIVTSIEELCRVMRNYNVVKITPCKGIYKEDILKVEYVCALTEDDLDGLEELVEEDS